jgi:hypothetical protein
VLAIVYLPIYNSTRELHCGCHSYHFCYGLCELCAETEETVEHGAYNTTQQNQMAAFQDDINAWFAPSWNSNCRTEIPWDTVRHLRYAWC